MFGNILITGATGSFGKAFLNYLIKIKYKKKIIIFSRDELKQYHLKKRYPHNKNLRFFLGDIRDLPRLNYAFSDVDTVVHAAALKQVDTAEYNSFEYIKTNIFIQYHYIPQYYFKGLNNNLTKYQKFYGAERFYNSALSLPIYPYLKNKEIIYILESIKKFISKK